MFGYAVKNENGVETSRKITDCFGVVRRYWYRRDMNKTYYCDMQDKLFFPHVRAGTCYSEIIFEAEAGDEGDLHGWIFGCDICQLACPHNRHAPVSAHTCFAPAGDIGQMTETDWLQLSGTDFQNRFGDTPLARCGLERIQRRIRQGSQK